MGTSTGVTGSTVRAMQGRGLGLSATDGRHDVRVELQLTVPRAIDLVTLRNWLVSIIQQQGPRVSWIDVVETD